MTTWRSALPAPSSRGRAMCLVSRATAISALVALTASLTVVAASGNYADFLAALAARESGNRPTIVNSFGNVGLYQFGEAALVDAGYYKPDGTPSNDWKGVWTGKNGIHNLTDFLSNPMAQNQAVAEYHGKVRNSMEAQGLGSYIGQNIGGVLITESGLIAGAHLVGVGALKTFLSSGGASVPRDGNNVPVTTYISDFGGYAISSFAAPPAVAGAPGTLPAGLVGRLPNPPAAFAVPPGTAFANKTGRTPSDVRQTIASIIAALLAVFVAWVTLSVFNSWRKGKLDLMQMQVAVVRALVVLIVLVSVMS